MGALLKEAIWERDLIDLFMDDASGLEFTETELSLLERETQDENDQSECNS